MLCSSESLPIVTAPRTGRPAPERPGDQGDVSLTFVLHSMKIRTGATLGAIGRLVLRGGADFPRAFAELIQSRLEAARQFVSRSRSPIVQKVNGGLRSRHVMMNRDNVQPIRAE